MAASLLERYSDRIAGVLSCYDRVVATGTLTDICHPAAMSSWLFSHDIRIFDYTKFAEPLRDEIRHNAEALAAEAGLKVEPIRTKRFRKEARIEAILAARGDHPGLVHVFSAMERCTAYSSWYDKPSGKALLRVKSTQCLHYYFYFILPDLGLCYVRVPTWAPFRLQVYFNGHNWLAAQLKQAGIGFTMRDNAFVAIDDFERAQRLADSLDPRQLRTRFDEIALRVCPVLSRFARGCYWSLMQVEYATDIVFRSAPDLKPVYDTLARTAIHAVKPDDVATFLGHKLDGRVKAELGGALHTRVEGLCIKHHMGKAAIKMYDKFGQILRIETLANDVSFFKDHRWVEPREGQGHYKTAPLPKNLHSLEPLRRLMGTANGRYVEFLSALDDPSAGIPLMEKIASPAREGKRSYRGFNLLDDRDLNVFRAIARGEFAISGFTAGPLRHVLGETKKNRVARLLKRLRVHGLIKKVGRRYKYYLTRLGQRTAATALKLSSLFIIPSLAA